MSASLFHASRKSFVGFVTAGLIAIAAMTSAFGASSSAATPTISDEASAAVAQMSKTLLAANQFSFQAHTIRVYAESSGQPLHIAHTMKVIVRRPDRLKVDVAGDDGSTQLIYDGKTAVVFGVDAKKYATVPVPNTLQGALSR